VVAGISPLADELQTHPVCSADSRTTFRERFSVSSIGIPKWPDYNGSFISHRTFIHSPYLHCSSSSATEISMHNWYSTSLQIVNRVTQQTCSQEKASWIVRCCSANQTVCTLVQHNHPYRIYYIYADMRSVQTASSHQCCTSSYFSMLHICYDS